jgi:hypothetical protein
MAKTATLKGVITLDASPFFKGINKAMAFARGAAKQFKAHPFKTTAIVAGLGGAGAIRGISSGLVGIGNAAAKAFKYISVGAGAVVAAFTAGAIGAIHLGGVLDDLSNRTGQTVANSLILRKAFQLAGLEADQTGALTNKLQKALSGVNERGQSTAKVFDSLHLNMAALRRLDAPAQYQAIGDALNGVQDPTIRAADAMAIFGKAGGQVLQLFRDPNTFRQASESLGQQTGILQRNAAFFGAIEDKADRIKDKIQGFFVGVDDKIGLQLYNLLDKLGSIDLAATGQKFGAGLSKGIDAAYGFFADPKKFTSFLANGFTYATLQAGNVLLAVFQTVEDGFNNGLVKAVQGIGDVLLGVLLKAFAPAIAAFQGGLEYAMQAVLSKLPLSLGGVRYRDPKKEADASAGIAHAEYERRVALKEGRGDHVDILDAEIKARKEELTAMQNGPQWQTREQLTAKYKDVPFMDASGETLNADQKIKKGIDEVAQAGSDATDYAKSFKLKDRLGAGAYGAAAAAQWNEAAAKGKAIEPPTRRMNNSHGVPYSDVEFGQMQQTKGDKYAYEHVYGQAGLKQYETDHPRSDELKANDQRRYAAIYGPADARLKASQGFDFYNALKSPDQRIDTNPNAATAAAVSAATDNEESTASGQGPARFPNINPAYGNAMQSPVAGNIMGSPSGQGGMGGFSYTPVFGGQSSRLESDSRLTSGSLNDAATPGSTNGFDGNAFYKATGRIHGYSSSRQLSEDAEKAGLNKKDPALAAQQATAKNTAAAARQLGATGVTDGGG